MESIDDMFNKCMSDIVEMANGDSTEIEIINTVYPMLKFMFIWGHKFGKIYGAQEVVKILAPYLKINASQAESLIENLISTVSVKV